jgi:ABC-type amino acid transport substrate-binding protein
MAAISLVQKSLPNKVLNLTQQFRDALVKIKKEGIYAKINKKYYE